MKKFNYPILSALLLFAFTLSSCEIVGDIFQAGIWVGLILVVIVIVIIVWIFNKFRRK